MAENAVGPCSECRFWKDPDTRWNETRLLDWRECTRAKEHGALIVSASMSEVRDSDQLLTAPYFGCVQWEQKP